MDALTAIGTASSTPSRRAGLLFLTDCARLSLKVFKGDAKAAFLQGDLSDSAVFTTPVPELIKALNAPRRWRAGVVRDLVAKHWTPMVLEPCVMVLRDESRKTRAICMLARG